MGLGTAIIGYSKLSKYVANGGSIYTSSGARISSIVFLTGLLIMDVGIPLWIAGGIKESNNKKAMKNCKKPDASLNLGVTENGVGLVYKF